jgi:hypothetical protein
MSFLEKVLELRTAQRKERDELDGAIKVLQEKGRESYNKFKEEATKLIYDNLDFFIVNKCMHDIAGTVDCGYCVKCHAWVLWRSYNGIKKIVSDDDKIFIEDAIRHYTECIKD